MATRSDALVLFGITGDLAELVALDCIRFDVGGFVAHARLEILVHDRVAGGVEGEQ